ncbi:MAG: response regulator [bacterium]
MKPTILIIEDDPRSRKLLSDLLKLKGYEVFEALDGAAGIKVAAKHKPGLILMDIQMPDMDGFDAVQILKGDPQTCALTIWALTAYAMPGDETLIRTRGCDDYFTKPLDLRDLLTRIEQHFDGRRPQGVNMKTDPRTISDQKPSNTRQSR